MIFIDLIDIPVPPLKGLNYEIAAYPALKRWAILFPSRNAGLGSRLSKLTRANKAKAQSRCTGS
jgi:hypothetical protein